MMYSNNFKFVKREVPIKRKEGNKYINDSRIVIGLEDLETGLIFPHPISDFIDKEYYSQSKSINVESGPADAVVQFLNYVFAQLKEEHEDFTSVRGINDLELKHLEHFLTSCSEKGNKRSTVDRKKMYLIKLFYFLSMKKNRLKNAPKISNVAKTLITNSEARGTKVVLVADLSYKQPKDRFERNVIKKKDMLTQTYNDPRLRQEKRINYIREFILIASMFYTDIALAVALQFYGGLRAGECMNLTKNAFIPQNGSENGENGLIVKIRYRGNELFTNSANNRNNQVKNERDQSILIDPLIPYLFKNHKRWLAKKKSTHPLAIFINSKGEPMQVHTYRQRFSKLKDLFLGILNGTEGRYQDFKEFRDTKWSTHIGRGAFTNLCLEGGFNAVQTAILRGDKSPQSMYAYTDILTASYNISLSVGLLAPENSNELSEFSMSEVAKRWEDVIQFGKKMQQK